MSVEPKTPLHPLPSRPKVTSFTLSQAGMARRHLRLREPGWRKGLLINGTGALITLVVIAMTKFVDGAWIVCIAIPALVLLLQRVQRTYCSEVTQLKVEASQGGAPPKPRHEVLVPRRRYVGFWRRVLHDQTSAELTRCSASWRTST